MEEYFPYDIMYNFEDDLLDYYCNIEDKYEKYYDEYEEYKENIRYNKKETKTFRIELSPKTKMHIRKI